MPRIARSSDGTESGAGAGGCRPCDRIAAMGMGSVAARGCCEAVNSDQPAWGARSAPGEGYIQHWMREVDIACSGWLRLYCRIEDPAHVVDVDEVGEEGAEVHELRVVRVIKP